MADAGPGTRWLLYGVISAESDDAVPGLAPNLRGPFACPCSLLTAPPLAAIASPLSPELLLREPKTADLLAYSRVVEQVHAQTTVVPLRFGSVLADEAAVRAYLAANTVGFAQLLERLHGTEELAVRLLLPAPEIAPSPPPLLTTAAGAGAAYLRARQLHHAQTAHRQSAGERRAEWLRQALRPHALDERTQLLPQGDEVVVSAAFLIRRGSADSLRARARELAASESLKLHVSGPFPPFSFAELAADSPDSSKALR